MMPHLTWTVVIAGCLFASAQVPSERTSEKSVLVYSGDESFWTDGVRGWILDSEAGRQDGPIVVLYRVGKTWQTSQPVMYANVSTSRTNKSLTVAEAIKADTEEWRSQVSDLLVKE